MWLEAHRKDPSNKVHPGDTRFLYWSQMACPDEEDRWEKATNNQNVKACRLFLNVLMATQVPIS